MIISNSFLLFIHLIGMVIGIGAASVKLLLLIKCKSNFDYINVFVKVSKPITKLIVLGLILLTISGLGWIIIGYSFSFQFIIKIILVVIIWILGPIIDNVIEPKFNKMAASISIVESNEVKKILNNYLIFEATATSLFYIIIIYWILF